MIAAAALLASALSTLSSFIASEMVPSAAVCPQSKPPQVSTLSPPERTVGSSKKNPDPFISS